MKEYFVKVVAKAALNKVFIHAKIEDVFDDLDQLRKLLEKNTMYYVHVYRNDFPSYDYVTDVIEVRNLSSLIEAVKNANIKVRKAELKNQYRTLKLPKMYHVVRTEYAPSVVYGNRTFIEIQKVEDPYAGVNTNRAALELHGKVCHGNVVSLPGHWRMIKENQPFEDVYTFYYEGE